MRKLLIGTLMLALPLMASCTAQTTATANPGVGTIGGNVTVGSALNVTIQGFAFNPSTLNVIAGQTVTWTNNDSTPHTVSADDNSFTSPNLASGQSFSKSFAAGTIAYHCNFHPSMKATLTVR
jgi:plastocyanin